MSVLLDTSAGEIVIDLFCEDCPLASKNFLKLCKIKYYNGCLFYNVQQNFIAQTGDPTGTGRGGNSVYGMMYGPQATSFEIEKKKHLTHNKVGVVSMAGGMGNADGEEGNRSQFFITLRGEDMEHLDEKHTIFGEVAEGLDVLQKINELYTDENFRPFQDVRIRHTYVLDDDFPDPAPLLDLVPPQSPEYEIPPAETVKQRIPYEEITGETEDKEKEKESEYELEQRIKRKEAESREIVLEMTGDIPNAMVKPPEEVLFVAKLNPVTTDDDLELIFSRFGPIKDCSIIRDYKTGDSLNYAFIEFETEDAVLEAYEKMNNVLIDDRRIKVDFSQSVAKLWNKYLLKPHDAQSKRERHNVVEGRGNGEKSRDHTRERHNSRSEQHGMKRSRDSSRDRDRRYSDRDSNKNRHGNRERRDGMRSEDKRRGHRSHHRSRSRSRSRSRNRRGNKEHEHGRNRDRKGYHS